MGTLPLPLPPHGDALPGAGGFVVELVDPDLWRLSSAPAHASIHHESGGEEDAEVELEEDGGGCLDLDEIEELRLRKKLFYKLDRGSMEFEECSLSLFRRQKSKSKEKKNRKNKLPEKSRDLRSSMASPIPPLRPTKTRCEDEEEEVGDGKKSKKSERAPTFNQLTDRYHLPFCLDIYISKGSVRACVVHRATSTVVAVAHSISKDMKFDLASRRDAAACAAVGAALAQRALSDDIHNVVYTPRKGERIEGKLQIVLQSIMDNGIDVNVKMKQRKPLQRRGVEHVSSCSTGG